MKVLNLKKSWFLLSLCFFPCLFMCGGLLKVFSLCCIKATPDSPGAVSWKPLVLTPLAVMVQGQLATLPILIGVFSPPWDPYQCSLTASDLNTIGAIAHQAASESAAAFGTGFLSLLDLSLPLFAFWSAGKGLHKNLLAGSTTLTGSFA